MGNQQNRSRCAFLSNITSFTEIKKVIEESNLILRFFFFYIFFLKNDKQSKDTGTIKWQNFDQNLKQNRQIRKHQPQQEFHSKDFMEILSETIKFFSYHSNFSKKTLKNI